MTSNYDAVPQNIMCAIVDIPQLPAGHRWINTINMEEAVQQQQ